MPPISRARTELTSALKGGVGAEVGIGTRSATKTKRVRTAPRSTSPTAVYNNRHRVRSAATTRRVRSPTPGCGVDNETRSIMSGNTRGSRGSKGSRKSQTTTSTSGRKSHTSHSTASTSASAFRGKVNDKRKKRLPSILTFRKGGDGKKNGKAGDRLYASSSGSSDDTGLTYKSKTELLTEFTMLMSEFPTEDTLNTTLHVACLKHYSSELIVEHLIAKGPSAVSMKNAAGDLPLHSAMRDCDDNKDKDNGGCHNRVFNKLVQRYPNAVKTKNKEECLPIHLACQAGGKHVYAVKRLLKDYPPSVMMKCSIKMGFDEKALEYVRKNSEEEKDKEGETDDIGIKEVNTNSVEDMQCFSSFWSRVIPFSPAGKNLDTVQESASTDEDDQDTETAFTPLHLAILHSAPPDVVEAIISANPECLSLRTSRGRRAIDIARFLDGKANEEDGAKNENENDEVAATEYDEEKVTNTTAAIEILQTFEVNTKKSMRLAAALNFASTRNLGNDNIKDFDAKAQWRKLANMIRFAHGLKKAAPSLGPEIPYDAFTIPKPTGYDPTPNLFHVCTDVQLPVGFRRLRWAMLSSKSNFMTKTLHQDKLEYTKLEIDPWDIHDDEIGKGVQIKGTNLDKFVGAQRKCQYLMPRSGIVSANMAFETHTIMEYSDYAFAVKKVTRNPDVPFGKTFECHVQTLVMNTGDNTCRLVGSVEAVFLGKPPMIAFKIKNGMYTGVTDYFVVKGETICEHTFQQNDGPQSNTK